MDIFFNESKYRILAAVLAFTGCVLMVVFPDISLLSAQKGIALWIGNVLPALLPFFICAGFMNALGFGKMLSNGLFTFMMSVFSGYPMGAKIIGDLRRNEEIGIKDARRLISFCSTSGPAFILSSVGAGMLGSVHSGAVIAIAHYAGALATGAVMNLFIQPDFRFGKNNQNVNNEHRIYCSNLKQESYMDRLKQRKTQGCIQSEGILEMFTRCILEALKSLGIVLAYIVMFMFITDLIEYFGVFGIIRTDYVKAIAKGMVEMTVGCSMLSLLAISENLKIIVASFLISFGGLSIIGQSMSMLSGSGISLLYFGTVKLVHASLAAGIAAFLLIII